MTKLEIANKFFFQWLFVRLMKGGRYEGDDFIVDRWGFLFFILPLTGWWNNYIWIGKKNTFIFYHKYAQAD